MASAVTIGRAARAANVGVETVRFYERQRLIEQPPRRPGETVRRYPPEVVGRIRFIREAQRLGFTLREVRELLALHDDPTADCADVRGQATAKLAEVRSKIEQLQRIVDALEALVARCPARGSLDACTIIGALISQTGSGE